MRWAKSYDDRRRQRRRRATAAAAAPPPPPPSTTTKTGKIASRKPAPPPSPLAVYGEFPLASRAIQAGNGAAVAAAEKTRLEKERARTKWRIRASKSTVRVCIRIACSVRSVGVCFYLSGVRARAPGACALRQCYTAQIPFRRCGVVTANGLGLYIIEKCYVGRVRVIGRADGVVARAWIERQAAARATEAAKKVRCRK